MKNTTVPSNSTIRARYAEINNVLDSIYARAYTREAILPGEFIKLFSITNDLYALSSFFSMTIQEKKDELNRPDVFFNRSEAETLQQEIYALQKLLNHNEGVYMEVDVFIYRLLATIPPFTAATQ